MSELLDTALRRVRIRMWKRAGVWALVLVPVFACAASPVVPLPYTWAPAVVVLLFAAFSHWTYHKNDPTVRNEAARMTRGLVCAECGYDLRGFQRGADGLVRCPECGLLHEV